MEQRFDKPCRYPVREINGVMETLRRDYDVVRLVDVEECRVLDIQPDGTIHHGASCFRIWNRDHRCANCSSYRACKTHTPMDKTERLGEKRERIHSVPVYLELLDGELELCVLECVKLVGRDAPVEAGDEGVYINTHDVLTRLYTQEKLFREIRQRLMDRPEDRYLLVMGNIRNFHLVNRLFGVEAGNRVLVGIADLLREECSPEAIYGRYRDDRFVLLMRRERFDPQVFAGHLQRLQGLLESPIFTIQIKLGVYEITDPEMPVLNMLDHAEVALDTIRDMREEFIAHYAPGMLERRLRDQRVVSSFQQALDQDEFQIYLQPQVWDDGAIHGAEALVRWQRSDGEIIPPGDFLEVLHKSELLSHLDLYVWEKAARLLKKWQGSALRDLYISINVDPTDFFHLDVPGELSGLCKRYGLDPRRLRVEITETALIEDVEKQSQMVERLHREGFIVEIDDFGKGCSSLSLLKDIHADVLKIDMGFVRSTRNNHRSSIILGSVVDMANQLRMGVITEGVETREQVERLQAVGCHSFQGFYYSRPVPVPVFEAVALENLETHPRPRK